ncbi:MAG: DUF2493 domain-containing protein [Chitinophagia bacterium]|nr:DUF2493 domain-containing protein [Chitinophagia bacterium]
MSEIIHRTFAIVGSRSFFNRAVFDNVLIEIISFEGIPNKIVSGGASGTDSLAYSWAEENNIEILVFRPNHKDFPKKVRRWEAPKARNTLIVTNSDIVIAFWDMKSSGTNDTINKSIENGKKTYVYDFINAQLKIFTNAIKS